MRRQVGAVALALLLALPGCGLWGRQRLRDAGDVIDLKYGRSMGLGAKVEATLFLGAGLGLARIDSSTEWYGRARYQQDDGLFLHLLIVGVDRFRSDGGSPSTASWLVGPVNVGAWAWRDHPTDVDRVRFGGELVLPFVHGGLYLNLGQLFDLAAGVFGFDPAEDDSPAPANGPRPRPEASRPEPDTPVDD